MNDPTYAKLSSAHFYVWKTGLKGTYYLRSRPAADPISFTVDKERVEKLTKGKEKIKLIEPGEIVETEPIDYSGETPRCGLKADGCLACSS